MFKWVRRLFDVCISLCKSFCVCVCVCVCLYDRNVGREFSMAGMLRVCCYRRQAPWSGESWECEATLSHTH